MAQGDKETPPETLKLGDAVKLLAEQNQKIADVFLQSLNKSQQPVLSTPKYNSVKLPKFNGASDEDVNEFLINFDRAAKFHKWNDERKAEALPLHLLGNAGIWFNSTPELSDKPYSAMADALRNQFHSSSDRYLLRQKLHDRKQLPTETVATYAADIRRMSRRIEMPSSETVNHFIQGLKPSLKTYVLCQQPENLEEAERHAKLKEAAPDPMTEKIDQVINLLTSSKQPATVATLGTMEQASHYSRPAPADRPLTRDDVAQIVRQEMGRSNQNRPSNRGSNDYRNRRTQDGRPICHYCGKIGHISTVCRQRLGPSRDPRLPSGPRRPPPQFSPRMNGQQHQRFSPQTGPTNLN